MSSRLPTACALTLVALLLPAATCGSCGPPPCDSTATSCPGPSATAEAGAVCACPADAAAPAGTVAATPTSPVTLTAARVPRAASLETAAKRAAPGSRHAQSADLPLLHAALLI